jgi:hypothetical protein
MLASWFCAMVKRVINSGFCFHTLIVLAPFQYDHTNIDFLLVNSFLW